MYRPRVIPVLLVQNNGLVKTVKFKKPTYIGDPINAVHIFNDLKADEIVFLDINASKEGRTIDLNLVKEIGEEANMPFTVGGGIRSIENIKEIIAMGAERIVIGHYALENPTFIQEAANTFGSSTLAVCIDSKKNIFGKTKIYSLNGKKTWHYSVVEFAQLMQDYGAGEIILQSIDRDGVMQGYAIDLIKQISENVSIPVIALGGAGQTADLKQAFHEAFASGVAAGSLFVYQNKTKGVLINYPENVKELF